VIDPVQLRERVRELLPELKQIAGRHGLTAVVEIEELTTALRGRGVGLRSSDRAIAIGAVQSVKVYRLKFEEGRWTLIGHPPRTLPTDDLDADLESLLSEELGWLSG